METAPTSVAPRTSQRRRLIAAAVLFVAVALTVVGRQAYAARTAKGPTESGNPYASQFAGSSGWTLELSGSPDNPEYANPVYFAKPGDPTAAVDVTKLVMPGPFCPMQTVGCPVTRA